MYICQSTSDHNGIIKYNRVLKFDCVIDIFYYYKCTIACRGNARKFCGGGYFFRHELITVSKIGKYTDVWQQSFD